MADKSLLVSSLTIAVSVWIAAGGWIFAYLHGRKTATRAARLERVNRQLGLFYGPLLATLESGDAAWRAFWRKYRPAHGQDAYFAAGYPLTDEELRRWRLWMTEVFHPNNLQIESLINSHLELIVEDEMPREFTDALAHIAVYRAVIARWAQNDFSEHTSVINFPSAELIALVKPTYKALKAEQLGLISDTHDTNGAKN